MEEMIAKLARMKEIEAELATIDANRSQLRIAEGVYRKERRVLVGELRALGITIARPRKEKKSKEKKSKEKPAPTA